MLLVRYKYFFPLGFDLFFFFFVFIILRFRFLFRCSCIYFFVSFYSCVIYQKSGQTADRKRIRGGRPQPHAAARGI